MAIPTELEHCNFFRDLSAQTSADRPVETKRAIVAPPKRRLKNYKSVHLVINDAPAGLECGQFGEFFVPGISGAATEICVLSQNDTDHSLPSTAASPSLLVLDTPTCLAWGISPDECRRLVNAGHFLKEQRRQLWWVSTQAGCADARRAVDDITRLVVKQQKRYGLPQYWLRVGNAIQPFTRT